MNGFDIMLVVALVAFAAMGAVRGMAREVATIVAWVAALMIAWLFAADVESWFDGLFAERTARVMAAFLALFGIVWIGGTVAGHLVSRHLLGRGSLRIVDRVAGGLIGFARGAVIVVAVFLAAGLTSAPMQHWWRESALAPHFERLAVKATQYLPRDVARHIRYG
jgi:membrane protein required for colicin V production